ncbi:hypothetical protein EDB89DRAFT_2080938 [Lactarius sanguifluus]|nr:hypothetical protein EDB89DRAFT_2080938 [Lactarius sanguifluus]
MAIELMTAAAVFDATCPATPTPLPLALSLALAWTSRPSRCLRAALQLRLPPHTTPGPRNATVERFDPSTLACDAGIVPWYALSPLTLHCRPMRPSAVQPPPLPARPRDLPRSQPPLLTIRRDCPQAITLPAREPVRPDTGISITTMAILNSFVNDIRPSSPRPDTGISNKTKATNSFVNDIRPLLTTTHAQCRSRRDRLQVHTSISNKTTAILNSFVNDIFERKGVVPRFVPPTSATVTCSRPLTKIQTVVHLTLESAV